jgi:hypothetical protein
MAPPTLKSRIYSLVLEDMFMHDMMHLDATKVKAPSLVLHAVFLPGDTGTFKTNTIGQQRYSLSSKRFII